MIIALTLGLGLDTAVKAVGDGGWDPEDPVVKVVVTPKNIM